MGRRQKKRSIASLVLAGSVVFIPILWIVLMASFYPEESLVSFHLQQVSPPEQSFTTFHKDLDDGASKVIGTHTILSDGTEIVYSISMPTIGSNKGKTNRESVALLLHGCSHNALKFFSESDQCSSCVGLSEELQIARLMQSEPSILAVVAVTSQDRKTGCWSGQDVPHVQNAIVHLKRKLSRPQIPVFAFGASSGGKFSAQLAVQGIVNAAMVGVMSLGHSLVQQWCHLTPPVPPIYLAPMPRDKRTLAAVQKDFATMSTSNNAQYAVLDTDTCLPFPVTATYLHQRVPNMTHKMAAAILEQLNIHGHRDIATGMLIKDPTKSDWRTILKSSCASLGCLDNQPLAPGLSPLAKAFHRAWAMHEYCSEASIKALRFFQSL